MKFPTTLALQLQVLLSLAVPVPALAALAEEPPQQRPSTPQMYTKLVQLPDKLVMTNTSDRPIVAWMIRTVTRSSKGYEAISESGTDKYRNALFPGGTDEFLQPGESVTIEKPNVWLREDHRGQGAGTRHYVGMIVFENNEAVGDADLVEQTFERRLDEAREAAAALHALDVAPARLRDLPMYKRILEQYAERDEALEEIRRSARENYRIAVDHLRPQDLEVLAREEAAR